MKSITNRIRGVLVRALPLGLLGTVGSVSAQTTTSATTTPGVPTTALGGFASDAILMSVFALALMLLAAITIYKTRARKI